MRWRNDDFISVLAITSGAALSAGLTATFLSARLNPAPVRVDVPTLTVEPEPREIAVLIPDGMRAISIAVDGPAAVDGRVRPGSRVTVVVQLRDVAPGGERVTRVLLEDVEVLGNDRTFSKSPSREITGRSIVTLLVTPEDAELVAKGSKEGALHVVLPRSGVRIGRLMVDVEKGK
jgi:Flp pilus assembly protein CpaB